jgi:DNA polymerase (family 10)
MSDTQYTDEKGRLRWRRNDEIARLLKELADLLIIGGYDPSHAARYPKLAYEISRHPDSVEAMHREGRLREIPGIGGTVAGILGELIETGKTRKTETSGDGYVPPPRTVLELTALPGLGAMTARRLYAERGIDSLAALADALDDGRLDDFAGLGPKLRETVRQRSAGQREEKPPA